MGFEPNLAVNPVDENLMCDICFGILERPTTACQEGHVFCAGCIDDWNLRSDTCPSCQTNMTTSRILCRPMQNMVMALQVCCPERVEMRSLTRDTTKRARGNDGTHFATAATRATTAVRASCGWQGTLASYLERHTNTECQYRYVECPLGCDETVRAFDLQEHQDSKCKNSRAKVRPADLAQNMHVSHGEHLKLLGELEMETGSEVNRLKPEVNRTKQSPAPKPSDPAVPSLFRNNSAHAHDRPRPNTSTVNGRNAKKRRTSNAINAAGASVASCNSNICLDHDTLDSSASEELSWFGTHHRRQNASNYRGGVRRNPYATVPSRRQRHPRTVKTMARMPNIEDLLDTDEEDDNVMQAIATFDRTRAMPKQRDAIRIAIGQKVFTSQCAIRYSRTKRAGVIILIAHVNGVKIEHRIDLDDESVLEMKYFVCKDDDNQAGATTSMSADSDDRDQMTFLALKVKPNDNNGLSTYSHSYQPQNAGSSDSRRYIAVQFRSDQDFLNLLKNLKKDASLGAFLSDSASQLSFAEAEVYGKSLFRAARKERAGRERCIRSSASPNIPIKSCY